MDDDPVRIGVAGAGGYAATIADAVLEHGLKARPPAALAAVCEPEPASHMDRLTNLRDRGITVYGDYGAMLADPHLEAVWLPLPIDLHRSFTEQALAAGRAVMCEKPAAGSVDEVDAMIRARDRAGLPVAIGFQDIYNPSTMQLKRCLLEGEIGPLRRASVRACWPRSTRYFARSGWAGRIRREGAWVLDSPAQNALSHFIMLTLFLCGEEPEVAATPHAVEAELYRAAAIENYDTITARVALGEGARLLVLLTHASTEQFGPEIRIEGERGSLQWQRQQILLTNETGERVIEHHANSRPAMIERFTRCVRGRSDPDKAAVTLEMARKHEMVVNGASQAASIVPVPEEAIETIPAKQGGTIAAIEGIEAALEACVQSHQLLHETGRLPFTQPAGELNLRGYDHFAGPAEGRIQESVSNPTPPAR